MGTKKKVRIIIFGHFQTAIFVAALIPFDFMLAACTRKQRFIVYNTRYMQNKLKDGSILYIIKLFLQQRHSLGKLRDRNIYN